MTSLPIKYYIGIDFTGFKRTIGQELGSIEVNVSQTLEDPWYPIEGAQLEPCGYSPEEIANLTASHSGFELESKFACRYEHLLFKQGKVKMEGHDALAYVRSRHSSSDYDRSRRQVEVLDAIRGKLFKLEALKNIPKFYDGLSKHVSTNLDLESVKYLAPLLTDADSFEIKSINLTPENVLQSSKSSAGAFIVIPKAGMNNWTEVQSFIAKQI
jgi:anionic cell wall polymer biosynthesis LytR-Cps2A-Psr (LCP) family protein